MSKKYLLLSILTILLIFTLPIHTDVSAKKNKEKTSEETSEADEAVSPHLNHDKKVVYLGKSFKLKLVDAEDEIIWSSSDETIATVTDGKVTGISEGYAYIYAECGGETYTCTVKVKSPELNYSSKRVRINNTFQLEVKGTTAVSFKSSKKKIASVNSDGVVTAKKEGTTVISVTCENGETYTCEVEVYLNIMDIEDPTFADLAPTVNMSFEELVGDNGIYDELVAMPAPGTYRLIVDLYHKVVMAYTKEENGEYTKPVRYMLCGVGASATPTPTGTFKMENYRLRYEIFNGTNCYGQYWSILKGRIYFHSILYTSFNAKDYTETSYDNLGKAVSHGCIRLTVPDARWIYYNVAPGTEVEVRKGSGSDKETAAIRKKLVLAKRPSNRPNLVKGEIPDTDNWTIDEVPQEVEFIQGSQNGGEAAG
ncbi:MAG: L,D-transpeptidase family protein [Lachnospiraceae bacterium]|nr:L,D-transpeptidase family protein [Lachnospiraceae bacterium]